LDAPATYCAIPVPFKALGKAEIGKMPIFGLSYKAVVVSVDRSSTTDRVKSFRKMKEFLAKGISILVFPEGTFHEGNEALLPFHDGAFKLALNMQAFIQPILLLDTQKRMNFMHLFQSSPGKNRVVVLPAIHTAGIHATQDSMLKNYVFNYMNACYEYVLKNGAENSKEFAQKYLDHQPINL
jgi:1-acyl-sn-glycerol-3-phosphate acyltransferase